MVLTSGLGNRSDTHRTGLFVLLEKQRDLRAQPLFSF